jgi:hypothetical protein
MPNIQKNSYQKCVYCLNFKLYTGNESTGCHFNAEHVLNRALVEGYAQNLTLIALACSKCNKDFDNMGLDKAFTRHSPEAFARYLSGQKSLDRLNEFEDNNNLTSYRVQEGILAGAQTLFRPEADKAPNLARAQVILSDLEPPTSIPWRKVLEGAWQEFKGRELTLLPGEEADLATMREFLMAKGLTFEKVGEEINIENEKPMTAQEITPTDEYLRAIAKNAFNYLAYMTSKHLPEHIFETCFEPIRNYVLTGVWDVVCEPVAKHADALVNIFQRKTGLWHRMSLYPEIIDGTPRLVCDVQAFSGITWRVILAHSYPFSDLAFDFEHVWDCDTKTNNMTRNSFNQA